MIWRIEFRIIRPDSSAQKLVKKLEILSNFELVTFKLESKESVTFQLTRESLVETVTLSL